MKITDIRLTPKFIPFKRNYGISSASYAGETFLLAKLIGEDGTFGLADSVAAVPFGYEDAQTMTHVIQKYLFPAIRGMESLDLEAIETRMEQAVPGHPMAKAVMDVALHDLNAKQFNVPLYQLLGGRFHETVPLAGAIGISDTERMVREAQEFVEQGFRTIKMKIGTNPKTDLERVREVRRVIGPNIRLRVDANQGCTLP
ncbi:MAG: enolase C-terminal domain-like protein [Anaerolineales bacterium]|nr:enolase C-terminal domain-like protein [Anaerolineales bacterium]